MRPPPVSAPENPVCVSELHVEKNLEVTLRVTLYSRAVRQVDSHMISLLLSHDLSLQIHDISESIYVFNKGQSHSRAKLINYYRIHVRQLYKKSAKSDTAFLP